MTWRERLVADANEQSRDDVSMLIYFHRERGDCRRYVNAERVLSSLPELSAALDALDAAERRVDLEIEQLAKELA